jgi:hypothetical protein
MYKSATLRQAQGKLRRRLFNIEQNHERSVAKDDHSSNAA